MDAGKTFLFLFLFGLFLVSSSAEESTSEAPPPPPPPHDWEKEIVTKVQEVYRPLNFPGGSFLDKVGFHHTGVIATTERKEDVLIHSYPGKAVEVTVLSLAKGPNQRTQWKAKSVVLDAKPGTTVADAMAAAKSGGGGSYRLLHNNCNDVSERVLTAVQKEEPSWKRRSSRRRKRNAAEN